MRRLLVLGLLILVPACRDGSRRVSIALPDAPEPLARDLVAAEVGRLLSADSTVSRAAEVRLTSLDAEGRTALLRHAERIPLERDPRWLLVLEENHALPPRPAEEEILYLLWKARRPETFYVMKAQNRLLDLARSNPDAVLEALETERDDADVLVVALALAGEQRAFLPLRTLYAEATSVDQRRAAAEALDQLTAGAVKPRAMGSATDIQADVDRLDAWWAAQGDPSKEGA